MADEDPTQNENKPPEEGGNDSDTHTMMGDATSGVASREIPKKEAPEKSDALRGDDAPKQDKPDLPKEETKQDKPGKDDKPEDGDAAKKHEADKDDESQKNTTKKENSDDEDPVDHTRDGVKQSVRMTPDGEESQPGERKLAMYDFDGTLTHDDSLKMILIHLAGGRLKAYFWLLIALVSPFWETVTTTDDYMDYKSAVKAHWMKHIMAGRTVEEVQDAARKVKDELGWRKSLIEGMRHHAKEDTDILVATGALDIYIDILLQGLPVKSVICTKAEVVDGRLTGALAGKKENANTVRHEKRVRAQEYIRQNGPYHRVIGYGNMPDDGPMLSLCDDFHVV